jgi:hypothetical protein
MIRQHYLKRKNMKVIPEKTYNSEKEKLILKVQTLTISQHIHEHNFPKKTNSFYASS